MASRRFSRKPLTDLCAEWTADDGIDPRLVPKRPHGKVPNRKTLQLCRQVECALSVVLEGEILRDLTVQSVMPAPDSSRLLVTFVYHGPTAMASAAVLAALHGNYAGLRGAIAGSIHRKKTPELAFRFARSEARPLVNRSLDAFRRHRGEQRSAFVAAKDILGIHERNATALLLV